MLSVLIVGVAEEVVVETRGLTRLLVRVWVSVVPTMVPEGAVTAVTAEAPLPTRMPVSEEVTSEPLRVVVLVPAVAPRVMAVVEPDAPPVPMLTVLVEPEAVVPVANSTVWVPVLRPNCIMPV